MIANGSSFWDRNNLIAALPSKTFGSTLKLILYVLNHFCGHQREHCWPSIATLSKATGATDRCVQQNLAKLVKLGVVEITGGGGRHKVNTYRLIPHALARRSGNPEPKTLFPQNPEPGSANPGNTFPEPDSLNPLPNPERGDSFTETGAGNPEAPSPQHSGSIEEPANNSHVVHRSETPGESHSHGNPGAPAPEGLDWKHLTDDDVRRIVRTEDAAAFRSLDQLGQKLWGWNSGAIFERQRAALWRSAVRKAKQSGGSPAALLKSALRTQSLGYACNDDDDWARIFLATRSGPISRYTPRLKEPDATGITSTL